MGDMFLPHTTDTRLCLQKDLCSWVGARKTSQRFCRPLSLLHSGDTSQAAWDWELLSSDCLSVSSISLQLNVVVWDDSMILTYICYTWTITQASHKQINCTPNNSQVHGFHYLWCWIAKVWNPDGLSQILKFILRCLDLSWDLAVYTQCHWKEGHFYFCVYTEADFRNPDWKIITDSGILLLRNFFLDLLNPLCFFALNKAMLPYRQAAGEYEPGLQLLSTALPLTSHEV